MTFVSGYSLLLNRQNFEWNKSKFSEQFKAATVATEFISLWQELTTFDSTGKAVPKEVLTLPISSPTSTEDQAYPTSSAGAKHSLSTSTDSSDLQSPTPKRAATTHSGSNHKQAYSSPIDNTIHSKRIGMFVHNLLHIHCAYL